MKRTTIPRPHAMLALLAFVAACQAVSPPPAVPLAGSWGGEHVSLVLDENGGALEYDCAAGTIDEPVRPDASGRFTAQGTHTPFSGGPERIDQPRPRLTATYAGRVEGGRLTLDVRAGEQHFGPFLLRRDAPANLIRCL
ncbi:MAG: hypothetical protein AB7Q23_00895 [Hyphomonadaceae bacterium]